MQIEKQVSYKCNFTNEEKEILKKSTNIISDLLKNMDSRQCVYADCTKYPEDPEGVSFKMIEDAKTVLYRLQNLQEIHE